MAGTGSGDDLTRLKVGDEGFLVSSLIERCPRVMMLRELVRNALEAAATAPAGRRTVEIDAVRIDGTPKLRIRNSGRGMDGAELFRMADLAASIRKQQGLDGNFGMGAKVASLPSNRLGLRYRSCHDGMVRETLLGWRDGRYGRIRQQGADGQRHEVLELGSDDAGADWTEVVLFGNASDQDTSLDPYGGEPPMPVDWLQRELSSRFFRIDDQVRLLLHGIPFDPLGEQLPRSAARHEIVLLPDSTRLHYAHCPPGQPPGPSTAMVGVVFRGELYDVRRDRDWLHTAPVFGVPFAAASVCLLVELPDAHPVVPDAYRQFLRHAGGRQEMVTVRDFAAGLHANRPGWLRAIIDAAAPDAALPDSVYGTLQALLRALGVRRRPRLVANGRVESPPDPVGGLAADPSPPLDAFDPEPVPELLLLRTPQDIEARGLVGRAGRYYPESHQLFLNGSYPALVEMREALETTFAADGDLVRVRRLAFSAAEHGMAARVGRMLVFALSRQGRWPDDDVAQALSPHALSLAADDWHAGLDAARDGMRRALSMPESAGISARLAAAAD